MAEMNSKLRCGKARIEQLVEQLKCSIGPRTHDERFEFVDVGFQRRENRIEPLDGREGGQNQRVESRQRELAREEIVERPLVDDDCRRCQLRSGGAIE